jgi:hypothetical protein
MLKTTSGRPFFLASLMASENRVVALQPAKMTANTRSEIVRLPIT